MARRISFELVTSKTAQSTREENGITRDKYEGLMVLGPRVGHSFTFYFDRNGGGSYDTEFHTSEIKSMSFEDGFLFLNTRNSIYKLWIKEEVELK